MDAEDLESLMEIKEEEETFSTASLDDIFSRLNQTQENNKTEEDEYKKYNINYNTPETDNISYDDYDDYDEDEEDPPLDIDEIISHGINIGASDVHITAGYPIGYRKSSDIIFDNKFGIITKQQADNLSGNRILITHVAYSDFMETKELDTSYQIRKGPHKGRRTRLNVGNANDVPSFVFRIITETIKTPQEIGIENNMLEWGYRPNGLILINGPTGSGKSNTIYSMIGEIQKNEPKRIVTLEKPVEYIYPMNYGKALITQREIGKDSRTFSQGLDSAMRQDPDIIVVGEVRNTEEIDSLLRAAETGHLAISSMHTVSPPNTISRIQQMFTQEEAKRILLTLSETTIGFANQVLVKKKNNPQERFAVRELMPVETEEVKEAIRKGDIVALQRIQRREGRTIEQQLIREIRKGTITKEEGSKKCNDILFYKALCEKLHL